MPNVYAYCTMPILSNDAVEKILKYIDKMIITDTTPHEELNGIECVSLTGLYAEATYRTHCDKSLSELLSRSFC